MTIYYTTKMDLTLDQAKRLKQGKPIRLSHEQLTSNQGDVDLALTFQQVKQVESAKKRQKGIQIKFDQEQLGGNPLLFSLLGSLVPEVVKGVSNLVRGKNLFTGKGQDGDGMFIPGNGGLERLRKKKRSGNGLMIPGRN